MHERRQRQRRIGPTQLLHIFAKPYLKSLGVYRLQMGYHIAPALIALNELLTHVWNSPHADAQDDEIEIVDHAQGLGRSCFAVPMRFEVAAFALKLAAID